MDALLRSTLPASDSKVEMPMRTLVFLVVSAWFVLSLGGCTGTTPIQNLALPPVSAIEGKITQLDESGFMLEDDTGSIYVRARLPDHRKLNLSMAEKVKVYGNLQGGPDRTFDGYVIQRATGEQIVVSNPSPHFGFVIQSSFK